MWLRVSRQWRMLYSRFTRIARYRVDVQAVYLNQYRLARTLQANAHAPTGVAATPIDDEGTDVGAPPTKATFY